MNEPRFFKENYAYIGTDEKWHIKDDAPEWAKNEFCEFMKSVNPAPDENGLIVQI